MILKYLFLVVVLIASCSENSNPDGNNQNNINNTNNTNNSNNSNNINNHTNNNTQGFDLLSLPGVRYGINMGHRNQGWSDSETANLAEAAGANSIRVSLPMSHLETWGYEIELGDVQHYHEIGMGRHLVAFLTKPIADCSTAPSGTADWELVYWMPSGLYEPIWDSEGVVNPDNCWAKYVFDTVSIYHNYIKIWEIWNEPDWISDWHTSLDWWETPPSKEDLPRFNGSIFNYIRMLRVSYEVIKHVDPNGLVATGGIGYESFADAIMRYTDNPEDGSVTNDYPLRGSSWFDVHSLHYYPIFGGGNSDSGIVGFENQLTGHMDVLTENNAGEKYIIFTESGAPHLVVGDNPGGEDYAANYLLKLMLVAHSHGVSGIDWFLLTDTAAVGNSTTPFAYMGLYLDTVDLSETSEAQITQSGRAYSALKILTNDAVAISPLDADRFSGDNFRGVMIEYPEGEGFALWAVTESDENGNATITFSTDSALEVYNVTDPENPSEIIEPGENIEVVLSSTPIFFKPAQ